MAAPQWLQQIPDVSHLVGFQALEEGGAFTMISCMGGAAVQCSPGRMQIHLTSFMGPWLGSLHPQLQMAIPLRCVTKTIWHSAHLTHVCDVMFYRHPLICPCLSSM